MKLRTQPIFISKLHFACVLPNGNLVVQSNRTRKGVQLLAPAATEWIDGIKTAIDTDEADALCRVILQAR